MTDDPHRRPAQADRLDAPRVADSRRSSSRAWLLAARPRTLPAAATPVVVGTALAAAEGRAQWGAAAAALAGSLLIQVGTNLANDYYDWKKGADTAARVGPTRATQAGLITPGAVLGGAAIAFALAALVGSYLVWLGGWPIVAIGVLALLCGWAYTGGPYPLGYNGLGDLFAFGFFGPVAVVGTFYAQTLDTSPTAWLASVPVGALVTAILVVNNLRDVAGDAVARKRTLAVRFGSGFVRREYACLVLLAFALLPLAWIVERQVVSLDAALLPLLALPLARTPLRRIRGASGGALNPALGETARLLLAWGLLFSAGVLVGGLT